MSEKEQYSKVTLSGMKRGHAEELFQRALHEVLVNFQDLNTTHKAKREINIKMVLVGNEERSKMDFIVQVTTKLANVKGLEGTLYTGPKLTAVEEGYDQMRIEQASTAPALALPAPVADKA